MSAIKDIVVQVIPGAPSVARQGFGIPAIVGLTGQRSVLITGTGSSGLIAKSTPRNHTVSLEIVVGAIYAYAFAAGTVTIDIPAGSNVRDLVADFNANAPSIVTDELTLEALTTGSGALGIISPTALTFEQFREIFAITQADNFFDITDPEYIMLANMLASKPAPLKVVLIDLFGTSDIATDIAAFDDGSWYAALTNSIVEAEQQSLSDYVDDKLRIALIVNSDEGVLDNIQSRRTAIVIHDAPNDHPEASWAAKALPENPGSITWKFLNSLQGQTANATATLSALQNVRDKKGQSYVEANGVSYMDEGKTTDPATTTFLDLVRSQDWVQSNLTADLNQLFFDAAAAGSKIPYTDAGIAQIESVIRNRLSLAGVAGIIAPVETSAQAELSSDGNFRFSISVPTRAEVLANDPSDITNRILPDITFQYVEAGAIHEVKPVIGRVILSEAA